MFLIPQVPKEFCRDWPVPGIVVIGKCKIFKTWYCSPAMSKLDQFFKSLVASDDGLVHVVVCFSIRLRSPSHRTKQNRRGGIINRTSLHFHGRHERCASYARQPYISRANPRIFHLARNSVLRQNNQEIFNEGNKVIGGRKNNSARDTTRIVILGFLDG